MSNHNPGKLIYKLFKGREVEISVNCFGAETLDFSGYTVENKYIVNGLVIAYHEDCGILELENHREQRFYLAEQNIDCFWAPGFKLIESLDYMIKTGKKLKKDLE